MAREKERQQDADASLKEALPWQAQQQKRVRAVAVGLLQTHRARCPAMATCYSASLRERSSLGATGPEGSASPAPKALAGQHRL